MLPSLVPLQRVDVFSRFTSFTENFVIRCYEITKKNSRPGHDCASSARSPCHVWFFGRYHNLGLSGSEKRCHAYPKPLLLAVLKVIHGKNWKRVGFLEHSPFTRLSLKLFWPFWQIMRRVSSSFLTHSLTSC